MCVLTAFNSLLWVDQTIPYREGSIRSGESRAPVSGPRLQIRDTAQPLKLLNHTTSFSTHSIFRGTLMSPSLREALPPRIQGTWETQGRQEPRSSSWPQRKHSEAPPPPRRRARGAGPCPRLRLLCARFTPGPTARVPAAGRARHGATVA